MASSSSVDTQGIGITLGKTVTRPSQELSSGTQQALLIGIVAGCRSMMPLAIISTTEKQRAGDPPWLSYLLASSAVKRITEIAAIAEVIGDKLPITSDRVSPGPLVTRLAVGALAGMILCHRAHRPAALGAAFGAMGAGFGTLAGYASRMVLSHITNIPDVVWGSLEDVIALNLGLLATRRLPPK